MQYMQSSLEQNAHTDCDRWNNLKLSWNFFLSPDFPVSHHYVIRVTEDIVDILFSVVKNMNSCRCFHIVITFQATREESDDPVSEDEEARKSRRKKKSIERAHIANPNR